MIITFDLSEWWAPVQIPDQELVSIHSEAKLWETAVTGDRWEELSWSESACDALTSLKEPGPLAADRETHWVVMCPWGGLGSAGSGSGRVSGCGWCAGRTPCLLVQPVLRSCRSLRGCRVPGRTDWCSSQMHVLECWCCSRCWMTERQKSTLAMLAR